jgi:hypothetical protein
MHEILKVCNTNQVNLSDMIEANNSKTRKLADSRQLNTLLKSDFD